MQQIPRSNVEIKPMFKATNASEFTETFNDNLVINPWNQVETLDGWRKAKDLKVGDTIICEDTSLTIKNIEILNDLNFSLYF